MGFTYLWPAHPIGSFDIASFFLMPSKIVYTPSENWEKWTAKQKKRIGIYNFVLARTNSELAEISDLMKHTTRRFNRLGSHQRRTKHTSVAKARFLNFLASLRMNHAEIEKTKREILAQVERTRSRAEDALDEFSDENMCQYTIAGRLAADLDSSTLHDFLHHVDENIHDWDSDPDPYSESEPGSDQEAEARPAVVVTPFI